jgi:hypothetical protein
MDMKKYEIMRIPFATVLFIISLFLITQYFVNSNSILDDIGAFVCASVLVYSIVLFAYIDIHIPVLKH